MIAILEGSSWWTASVFTLWYSTFHSSGHKYTPINLIWSSISWDTHLTDILSLAVFIMRALCSVTRLVGRAKAEGWNVYPFPAVFIRALQSRWLVWVNHHETYVDHPISSRNFTRSGLRPISFWKVSSLGLIDLQNSGCMWWGVWNPSHLVRSLPYGTMRFEMCPDIAKRDDHQFIEWKKPLHA